MIRIAVISDTHGDFRNVGRVRAQLGGVDWLLHGGDHFHDAPRLAVNLGVDPSRVRAVAGNCDDPVREPTQQVLELEGIKILLTHGHHEGVKHGFQQIYRRAVEAGARVVIFGHNHIALNDDDGRVLMLNPGSLTLPYVSTDRPSCALLEIREGRVAARLIFA